MNKQNNDIDLGNLSKEVPVNALDQIPGHGVPTPELNGYSAGQPVNNNSQPSEVKGFEIIITKAITIEITKFLNNVLIISL